ncbi:MAG: c-type cytochrome [Candidatus Eremiobacteraeota bacterium]|nr:c-type cytochrome [Candidatus Eremiobacteraeota bacterium]
MRRTLLQAERLKALLMGALIALVAGAALGYVAFAGGLVPTNADAKPSHLERYLASMSLRKTVQRESRGLRNPLSADLVNLNAGLELYGQNCAVCHGTADGKASKIALGLYQRPPQLAEKGVEDDPVSVTFWKVKHGIRLTGMPSFSRTLSDTQLWQIAIFLKQMDNLPRPVGMAWKRLHLAASASR